MCPTDCYLLQRGRHHEGRGGGHEEVAEADDEAARAEDGHAVHTLGQTCHRCLTSHIHTHSPTAMTFHYLKEAVVAASEWEYEELTSVAGLPCL